MQTLALAGRVYTITSSIPFVVYSVEFELDLDNRREDEIIQVPNGLRFAAYTREANGDELLVRFD